MNLPTNVANLLAPLFEELPPDRAMGALVVTGKPSVERVDRVKTLITHAEIENRRSLVAGLWLYIDDLDRSHDVSQKISGSTGAFWHGIMHRREGDFSNSHYWFNRAGAHAAMNDIPHYRPHEFIDDVKARYRDNPANLVDLQRAEWQALFEWCARHS